MKVERPPTDPTLPVPVNTAVHPSPVQRSPKARSAYDTAVVIDTVEIRRNDFQALPRTENTKKTSVPGAAKGLYIDLWA